MHQKLQQNVCILNWLKCKIQTDMVLELSFWPSIVVKKKKKKQTKPVKKKKKEPCPKTVKENPKNNRKMANIPPFASLDSFVTSLNTKQSNFSSSLMFMSSFSDSHSLQISQHKLDGTISFNGLSQLCWWFQEKENWGI